MRIEEIGEFGLIERIRRQAGAGDASVVLGIGDDTAALLPAPGRLLLATCDSQVEGCHFRREGMTAEQLGRRLAAVNLSDIAAMGGRPRWALASLVLPAATEVEFVEQLYRGLTAELAHFGAVLAGGNLAGGETLVLDLTLLGDVEQQWLLRRDGARSGDVILVSGTLGASAAGRAARDAGLTDAASIEVIAAHLTPVPRVREGQAIAGSGLATAMADISDGLARDLGHMCDASGVGAAVEAARLPLSAATRAVAARLGQDPIRLAVAGGEEYELLCTAPAEHAERLAALVERETGVRLTAIGRILSPEVGRWLELPDGPRQALGEWGWQHFERDG